GPSTESSAARTGSDLGPVPRGLPGSSASPSRPHLAPPLLSARPSCPHLGLAPRIGQERCSGHGPDKLVRRPDVRKALPPMKRQLPNPRELFELMQFKKPDLNRSEEQTSELQ